MGCPVRNNGEGYSERDATNGETAGDDAGLARRDLLKSALVIGGTSALSTVTGIAGVPNTVRASGGERISFAARENRQHAWDRFETDTSEGGVSAHPSHHVTLHLNYAKGRRMENDPTPDPDDRAEAAAAFEEVERHFEWNSDGLLFTVGYSPSYFDRFDEDLPDGLSPKGKVVKPGLLRPQDLIDTEGVTLDHEDPEADDAEVCLHFASNNVSNIMASEALLWGETVEIGGEDISFDNTLEGILQSAAPGEKGRPESYPYRRVGFSGHEKISGNLEEGTEFDPDRIPDDAELMMGFNDLYRNSIPREDNATILEDQNLVEPHPPGVFAQGTIQHVSKLEIDLDRFYDRNDEQTRRELMFSADHDEENTGIVGEELGDSNAPGDAPMRDLDGADKAEDVVADYEDKGTVGHAQKLARARFDLESRITGEGRARLSGGDREELLPAEERDDDLPGHDGNQASEQVILRRDVTSTDESTPGNLFISLMRFNPYMAYIRQAMNGVEFDSKAFGLVGENRIHDEAIGAGPDSGIVNYLETQRRGNYLVPPLTTRAFPHPRGEMVDIKVTPGNVEAGTEVIQVTVDAAIAETIDSETIRFGWFYDVNRGLGVDPENIKPKGRSTTYEFPADGTGIESAPGGPDGDVRVRFFAKRADTGRPVRGTAYLNGDG